MLFINNLYKFTRLFNSLFTCNFYATCFTNVIIILQIYLLLIINDL